MLGMFHERTNTWLLVVTAAAGSHTVPQRMSHDDRLLSALCRLVDTPLHQEATELACAEPQQFSWRDQIQQFSWHDQIQALKVRRSACW